MDKGHQTLVTGHWTFNNIYWTFDIIIHFGNWTFANGNSKLKSGHWTMDNAHNCTLYIGYYLTLDIFYIEYWTFELFLGHWR